MFLLLFSLLQQPFPVIYRKMQKHLFLASLVAIVSAASETTADDSTVTDAAEYSIDYSQLSSLYDQLSNTEFLLSAYSSELEAVYGSTWSEAAASLFAEATALGVDQLALASSLAEVYESNVSGVSNSDAITTPVESTISDYSSQTNSVLETDSSTDSSSASSGSESSGSVSGSSSSTHSSSSSGSSSSAAASSTGSSSAGGAQAIAVVPFVGTFAALLAALF